MTEAPTPEPTHPPVVLMPPMYANGMNGHRQTVTRRRKEDAA